MKRIHVIFTATILSLFACNDSSKEKQEVQTSDTTVTTPVTETAPAFVPFKVAMIQHHVMNFDKWKAGYVAHDSVRQAYGISAYVIGRELKDSNSVIVIDKMTDVQKAKEFSSLPNLKEAMKKAGVNSVPTFSYIDVVRNDDTKIDQKERIMIVHKVKDYDTWLKAYDREGKETRAANGLLDRGLGRGVDDPNMVYVVFAVTDMAKAKSRMSSAELKGIMTEAGVEGIPKFYMYKLVD
ncbi:MAG: hypothetical protein ABJA57_00835 [Ginsengibacter sp.]